MKRFFTLILFLIISDFVLCNSYTGSNNLETTVLRIPVWVFLETVPGSSSQVAKDSLPPRKALTDLSAFLLSGMIFGWSFSYIPSDITRDVNEAFDLNNIKSISVKDKNLMITDLTPVYPYLYCWAEYKASYLIAKRREYWKSISYKTAKGRGASERDLEIHGVYNAYIEALKNAVRNCARTMTKNKPREVIGEVLIKDNPRLFMKSGKFYADLEVFVHIKKIIPYEVF